MENEEGVIHRGRRPTASMDNTFLDLHNSSYDTQPHSFIVNYAATSVKQLWPPLGHSNES